MSDLGSERRCEQYALSLFGAAVARAADKPAIVYFDRALTCAELDRMSDALAAALVARGFAAGDRGARSATKQSIAETRLLDGLLRRLTTRNDAYFARK